MAEAGGGGDIVIKKIKKGGHGAHGGAWKVAYADFVTAMMAFFLLLWLLNATEAEKLAGLADYFAPTTGVKDKMGIGFRGGKSALSKGIGADKNTNKGIIQGAVPEGPVMRAPEEVPEGQDTPETEKIQIELSETVENAKTAEETEIPQDETLDKAEEAIYDKVINDKEFDGNVSVQQTPEGLLIQIVDKKSRPLFSVDSAELEDHAETLLEKISGIISLMPNYISITGHTHSMPFKKNQTYGNWELSVDRANSARRFLIGTGIPEEQIARVVGRADQDPLDTQNPESPVNNRIAITLLRKEVLTYHKLSAPDEVFLNPESQESKSLLKEEKEEEPVKEEPVKIKKVKEVEKKKSIFEQENVGGDKPLPGEFFGEDGNPVNVVPDTSDIDSEIEGDIIDDGGGLTPELFGIGEFLPEESSEEQEGDNVDDIKPQEGFGENREVDPLLGF